MQTFLPYPDFRASAEALDPRRLGKQRVEALQILNALDRTAGGWVNHPAVRMWRGHRPALGLYMNAMIEEWRRRGFRNAMTLAPVEGVPEMPPWLGREDLHASHRAALLHKEPGWYGRFGWAEAPAYAYVWPV